MSNEYAWRNYDLWRTATPWEGEIERDGTFRFELTVTLRGHVSALYAFKPRYEGDDEAQSEAEYWAIREKLEEAIKRANLFLSNAGYPECTFVMEPDFDNFSWWEEEER